jgi:hypothetical protein
VVSVTPRPRFTPGERTPGTHWIGGWVGSRAGLDAGARRKILCPCPGYYRVSHISQKTAHRSKSGYMKIYVNCVIFYSFTNSIFTSVIGVMVICIEM